ncbi:hypothetical protein GCM10008908_35390 [Clostridium subterminale]|uniref:RES domain-containing protein n=1 Tax=Clostridium subterminale TaxID=1550 RepID=A0ABP3W9Q6_CLOSU
MSCICCFFDNEHQKQLKEKCFGETTFKDKLSMYKKLYIDEFKKLNSLTNCNCQYSKNYINEPLYVQFCDDLLNDYRGKIDLLENLFDGLIEVYVTYMEGNDSNAYRKLDAYFNKYCTKYSSDNAMQFCNILFRGRPYGQYDNGNIYEYYHIPFSKKNIVGSQRFSIAGKPMLYLARSIPTAIQELGNKPNNVNFAAYYPKYSWVYRFGMYNITNSIDITLNNCIYPLIVSGSEIKYNNYQFTFSKNNADIIIGDSILFQILTFPVHVRNKQIEEYVLPQMFTDYLEKQGYNGLVYQSTKNIKQLTKDLRYDMLDYNYCFFVSEDGKNDYNEKLFECFYTICIGNCKDNITINDVDNLLDKCKTLIIKMNKEYVLDEYCMLKNNVARHIERMKKIDDKEKNYYDTESGKIEATLIYGLLEQVKEVIINPEKFDIVRR